MFEWDEARAAENLVDHGIDFIRAARMFANPILEREDTRQFWGERRFMALGHVEGVFLVVAWAPRGPRKRILSAWRADDVDEACYRAAVPYASRTLAGSQPAGRAIAGIAGNGVLEGGGGRLSLPKPPSRKASFGS